VLQSVGIELPAGDLLTWRHITRPIAPIRRHITRGTTG
jgi:hypothetical protein